MFSGLWTRKLYSEIVEPCSLNLRLAWVDQTYYEKHKGEDPTTLRPPYYPNLRKYATRDGSTHSKSTAEAVTMFLVRFGRKAGISLAVFALSYVPYVGRFVLPAASFYTFQKVGGLGPAAIVFGTGIFLPRRYLVIFLQSYFSSRSLMRELVSLDHVFKYFIDCGSLNPISLVSNSLQNRRGTGFMTGRVFFSASELDSTSSYGFPFSVFSFTVLLKHQPPTWLPRFRTHHHHQIKVKALQQVK